MLDVFLLLQKQLDFFDVLLGNWCYELVEEGLKNPSTELPEDADLEYLELCWAIQADQDKNIWGNDMPNFHGISKSGERMALELSHADDLVNYPLVLNPNFMIYEDINKAPFSTEVVYKTPTFTLGHILYGIVWELSFFGSPTDRDTKSKELQEEMENLDLSKCVLVEDLFNLDGK